MVVAQCKVIRNFRTSAMMEVDITIAVHVEGCSTNKMYTVGTQKAPQGSPAANYLQYHCSHTLLFVFIPQQLLLLGTQGSWQEFVH